MIVRSRFPQIISEDLLLCPSEMCYSVYLPIKVDSVVSIPENYYWVKPLAGKLDQDDWVDFKYWYLTVKHIWVSGYGNREGWHIDGFGSNDINYIWSDCYPTEFCIQNFILSEDHELSMREMEEQYKEENIKTAKANQLLRLSNTMVHRCVKIDSPTLRTFIKISCSNEKYNLKGNAKNTAFRDIFTEYVERENTFFSSVLFDLTSSFCYHPSFFTTHVLTMLTYKPLIVYNIVFTTIQV